MKKLIKWKLICDHFRAAFTLKIDHEVGSLETGKKADCCVLEEDPFDVDEIKFKDQKI